MDENPSFRVSNVGFQLLVASAAAFAAWASVKAVCALLITRAIIMPQTNKAMSSLRPKGGSSGIDL
jgi:hypothetical protein